MPLSEHEQRLLEQMERALYAEDPKFASSMQNPRPSLGDRRRMIIGSLGVLSGIGLLLAGVATRIAPIGVVGFLAMLAGIIAIIGAFRPAKNPGAASTANPRSAPGASHKPRTKRSGESLTERMEDRWRRRRETGDF